MTKFLPQITHVGIYVSNINKMVEYYTSMFNLVVTDQGHARSMAGAKIVFLSANPKCHHQIVLVEWPESKKGSASSVNQLSFKIASITELREMHGKLKGAGAKINPMNHGNALSVYTADPEGNGIEIYVDTPWYVTQPHGDPLDLSLSDEEILRQTEQMVRADPTFVPREQWAAELEARLGAAA